MALIRHLWLAALLSAAQAAGVATPVPLPLPGSRLIQSSRVDEPLEVRSATADSEAILAGLSYTKQTYREEQHPLTYEAFVTTYRDGLFAAGWKLIDSPKIDPRLAPPEGDLDISAHHTAYGRDTYIRITRTGEGTYDINVADVGDEDWSAVLKKNCRLPVPSIQFDLDRPTIRQYESGNTLQKLANVLKDQNAPAVEIQGHSDNIGEGGVEGRQALSEARAKAVAAWLTTHGVPAEKVTSKGYGKTRPIADNDSDLGRAMNRRIEVTCLK